MTEDFLAKGLALDKAEAVSEAADRLTRTFMQCFPSDASRTLESMSPADAAAIVKNQSPRLRREILTHMTPVYAGEILLQLPNKMAVDAISALETGPSVILLSQLSAEKRDQYFNLMDKNLVTELRELLDYPASCAAHLMDPHVVGLNINLRVKDALAKLKRHPPQMRGRIYTLSLDMRLYGYVDLEVLVGAEPDQILAELSNPIRIYVSALDPIEDVASKLQTNSIDILPVVDIHHHLLGVVRGKAAIKSLQENIAGDLQTMVGASRDERALSSSFFAVKKRQTWLQVNLLTGFLAASVVGLFESTIAQFTVLAVLMPVVAGQSGNTGAQALAVTMRGLTLREITTRHWLRVTIKEASAGFINGIAIAITCAAGVYFWSGSSGLALVVAMAMVISMSIAGMAGALVPICLKRLGQDPAQSSSIILTTVTDVAGFMSFLGIASLLSKMLV